MAICSARCGPTTGRGHVRFPCRRSQRTYGTRCSRPKIARFYAHHGVDVTAVVLGRRSRMSRTSGSSRARRRSRCSWREPSVLILGKRVGKDSAKRRSPCVSRRPCRKTSILEAQPESCRLRAGILRGYATASQAYFGTSPDALSLAQAALVAGLLGGRPSTRSRSIHFARDIGAIACSSAWRPPA